MTLRICILETDILRPELREQYQGYGHMFEQLFAGQPVPGQFVVYNVMEGHYPDDDQSFDAYLVTGSKADSFATDPWILTLKAYVLDRYQRGDVLIGVCFGHQLLALALGGKAERASQGWGLGVHAYGVGTAEPWMEPRRPDLNLLISHQDQVTALPPGAEVVASSPFCPYAAYKLGDQVLCFQGHPEFVPEYAQALLDLRRPHLGEALYGPAVATLEQGHDGRTVGEWIMRFIAQRTARREAATASRSA